MEEIISFFEIPASDFNRAVDFYESVFNIQMERYESETEKMAYFTCSDGNCVGAISWTKGFNPSVDGVLISMRCKQIEDTCDIIVRNGGEILIAKTKIEVDGKGYFAVFLDSEGNKIGLYADV